MAQQNGATQVIKPFYLLVIWL